MAKSGTKRPAASMGRFTSIAGPAALLLVILAAAGAAEVSSGSRESGSAPSGCVDRATRIVDLVLNLDAIAPIRRVPPALGSFEDLRSPNFSFQTLVLDPLGRPRPIVVHWARWVDSEWVVSVVDRAPTREPGANFRGGPLRLDPRTSSRVFFDDSGTLVGPDKIRFELPRAAAGFGEDGATLPDHPEQTIVLRLRSRRGETTQFNMNFTEGLIAHDGVVCRPLRPDQDGPCWLPADLRGDGRGGEGASIFFGAGGQLIDDPRGARARVQGFPLDLRTGGRLEAGDVRIPASAIPPRETSRIRFAFTLDVDAPIQTEPFDVLDLLASSQERIAVTTFDGVGRAVAYSLFLSRANTSDWRWALARDRAPLATESAWVGFEAAANEVAIQLPPEGSALPRLEIGSSLNGLFSNGPVEYVDILEGGTGLLRFDEAGKLVRIAQGDLWLPPGRLPVVGPLIIGATEPDASARQIVLDPGLGVTRLADVFTVSAVAQDGYGPGVITSVRVSPAHFLEIVGSNGVTLPAAELAFAIPGEPECQFVCHNGRDDDGDGFTDFPDDPDCASGFDGTE